MTYPKKVTIEDAKLHKLLSEKSALIIEGRAVSEQIDKLEKEMDEIDTQVRQIEKTVNIEEFHAQEQEIVAEVERATAKMQEIQKQIYAKIKEVVPEEMGKDFDEAKKKKEELEEKRNKIALKAQKYNDKIVPLGRKLMKPFLEDDFDDYDSIRLDNDVIVCTIFNHLVDFKTNFKKK